MAEFAQILIRAKDETKTAFDSAARNMRSLEAGATKLSGLLSTLGVGAGLSVVGLAAFAKSGIDAADGLNDMSQRLGVSVKDLASFKLAAEQSGTNLDSVGKGIQKLTLSIGQAEQGLSTQAKALKTLGITSRDSKEAFFQLADAVARSNDPIKTNAALNDVLGKRYAELLPLLSQGGDALRESARQSETFAEAMSRLAPNADKFNDSLATLKINAAGAAASGLIPLVDAINRVVERFETISKLKSATLGEILTGQFSADLPASIARVNREIATTQKELSLIPKGGFDPFGDRAALDEKLSRLQKLKAEYRAISMQGALVLAEQQYKKTPAGSDNSIKLPASMTTKADPLAGLLGSTDIGRLREFDKTVALINQRFNYGKKDTELYTQVMTKLVETTFANNFKQFAEDQKFMTMVMQDGKDTIKETNQAMQDWKDTVAGTQQDLIDMIDPVNVLVRKLTELDKFDGFIDPDVLTAARLAINAQIDDLGKAKEKISELDTFAKTAAENIQNSFADFLFDPFDKGLKGMAQSFGQTIQHMIANAVAADLAKNLFGGLADNGATSGSGWAGSALNWIGDLLKFDGGGYTGDGARAGGIDGKGGFLAVMHPRETVVDHTRGQSAGGGHTVIVNVYGSNNAPDVRRAAGQGAREALALLEGARRYG